MDRKAQEQNLLHEELKSLKKGATVYKQQQNSNIFFRTTKDKAYEECKNGSKSSAAETLDSLAKEYKEAERMRTQEETGEGT